MGRDAAGRSQLCRWDARQDRAYSSAAAGAAELWAITSADGVGEAMRLVMGENFAQFGLARGKRSRKYGAAGWTSAT